MDDYECGDYQNGEDRKTSSLPHHNMINNDELEKLANGYIVFDCTCWSRGTNLMDEVKKDFKSGYLKCRELEVGPRDKRIEELEELVHGLTQHVDDLSSRNMKLLDTTVPKFVSEIRNLEAKLEMAIGVLEEIKKHRSSVTSQSTGMKQYFETESSLLAKSTLEKLQSTLPMNEE